MDWSHRRYKRKNIKLWIASFVAMTGTIRKINSCEFSAKRIGGITKKVILSA